MRCTGYDNGTLIEYAIIYVNEAEWEPVRGRHGFSKDDYRELLMTFEEGANYRDDVIPAAESFIDECYADTNGKCAIEIEEYSPTASSYSPNIIDTIIIEEDGEWYHDNITTQGYGSDHCFD